MGVTGMLLLARHVRSISQNGFRGFPCKVWGSGEVPTAVRARQTARLCVIMAEAPLRRDRYCLDGTVWTAPLVVLVICFGSILVFMTIVFLFVYIETRRATGQVCCQSLPMAPPSLSRPHPACKPFT